MEQSFKREPRSRAVSRARIAARRVDPERGVEDLARLFRALGEPTRARMVRRLAAGEATGSEMAAALGLTRSAISHQLKVLKDLRLVRGRRDGRRIHYALEDEHVARLFREALDHVRHAGRG